MPLMYGSTTPKVAATATAASKALPPSSRTSRPARVASGWAELTIPFVPTAARAGVLLVAGPSRTWGPATVLGGEDSTVLSLSARFVRGDGVRSGTSPSAEVRSAVSPLGELPPAVESPPQEQSTSTTNAVRNGFFGTRTGYSTPVLVPTQTSIRLYHGLLLGRSRAVRSSWAPQWSSRARRAREAAGDAHRRVNRKTPSPRSCASEPC